ncbi:MAG: bifunctional DNA-formamidopyrimidine glycosylase/DNA-(apurinic or apyrimidinic site) lyase [Chromatiales bacterium]|nr:bifunctional DNA-formamidopyrimidine glycosylase/DNA-(apurinic or apyrimidinic site) lyase [Chromatiales bacterium]
MPELPEVETTRRGIAPHISGKKVTAVIVRQPKLRWPVPEALADILTGLKIDGVERRAKYLLLNTKKGTLILHLGMSGSLRILPTKTPASAHDHVDIVFGKQCLRLRDPRRFGAVLWTEETPEQHPLIAHLGPEPLTDAFSADHLYAQSRKRSVPVKNFIMEGKVVVGVGNIYANESLFLSGIHPLKACSKLSRNSYQQLSDNIKQVLAAAIEQGGTTLKDFQREDGKPGYFAQELQVYGKAGEPCPNCGKAITQKRIGQRSSFYCTRCQK